MALPHDVRPEPARFGCPRCGGRLYQNTPARLMCPKCGPITGATTGGDNSEMSDSTTRKRRTPKERAAAISADILGKLDDLAALDLTEKQAAVLDDLLAEAVGDATGAISRRAKRPRIALPD